MNKHTLIIENREKVRITSVNKAERFSDTEVLVYTENGDLIIKGNNLEVERFEALGGDAEIVGHIESIAYLSEKYHIPDNFLARLFR